MSWHFSQGPEGGFSEADYLAGIRSLRSKLRDTRANACCNGSGMEFCRLSRCGTMCELLTGDRGEGSSMSSPVDSRARISARRERGRASREAARGSGLRCTESFARFDRDTCLWRTPLLSLLADLDVFSETWPKRGMMRHGWCWELPTWELRTGETGFGFSPRPLHMIPTPTVCNAPNKGANTKGPKSLMEVALTDWKPGETWLTPMALDGMRSTMKLESLAKHWEKHPNSNLAEQVAARMFPTPCASGKGGSNAARKWKLLLPTPTCQDAKNNGSQSQQNRNSKPLNAVAGGALNPPWVEWLMGWPIGWTDSSPLEMDRFRLWLQLHSVSLNEFLKER